MPVHPDLEGLVLIDISEERGDFDAAMLERLGHRVITCNGPAPETLCPLLAGEGCEHFEQAHGILFELDLDRPQHRAILRRYRDEAWSDLPIKVIATPEQQEQYANDLVGIEVLDHAPTVADLDGFAAEVEAADRFR